MKKGTYGTNTKGELNESTMEYEELTPPSISSARIVG
jgi:hypothetical protein